MTDLEDGPDSAVSPEGGEVRWLLPAASGVTCAAGLLVVGLTVWTTFSAGELPSAAGEVATYALTLGAGLLLVVIGLVALGRPRRTPVDVRDELVSLRAMLSRSDGSGTPDPVENSWRGQR